MVQKHPLRTEERGLVRGNKPLLFDTLPEMPFWKEYVPFSPEPVILMGSNPLRLESLIVSHKG